MPHNHQWQSRIKAVEREHAAMRYAADRLSQSAQDDPTILRGNLRQAEIILARANLEGTYIIRLFAEFETGVREYWETKWPTNPRSVDLLDGWVGCEMQNPRPAARQRTRSARISQLVSA